jgi:hypothetical protein
MQVETFCTSMTGRDRSKIYPQIHSSPARHAILSRGTLSFDRVPGSSIGAGELSVCLWAANRGGFRCIPCVA